MQIIKSNRLWFFFYFISYLLSFFFCIIFKGIYKQRKNKLKHLHFFFNFFNNINLVLIRDVILFYKTENNKNKFVSNIVLLFI